MLIKLSDDVIDIKYLKDILEFINLCNGQHTLCTSKSKKIEDVLKDNIHYLNYYKELVVKSAFGIGFNNVIEITLNNKDDNQILLEDFYNILSKPAVLILENEHSDQKFIEVLLSVLNSRRLMESFNRYWEIRGGGGSGEIVKLMLASLEKLKLHSRISVVHDSDKYYPTDNLNNTHINIINKCREFNVSCVTLKKREIENYIVDEAISDIKKSSKDIIEAYLTLSIIQKDYFDLKKGINAEQIKQHAGLFNNLTPNTLETLKNGFGKDIAELAFCPQKRHHFNQKTLDCRCTSILPEFRKIESNIFNML